MNAWNHFFENYRAEMYCGPTWLLNKIHIYENKWIDLIKK